MVHKKSTKIAFFNIDVILATAFIFIFCWGLKEAFHSIAKLNPIHDAFEDADYSDIVYKSRIENPAISDNIFLVELPDNRNAIAAMLEKISDAKPKVIGIDASIEGWISDTVKNLTIKEDLEKINIRLRNAINNYKDKIVLVNRHNSYSSNGDTLPGYNNKFPFNNLTNTGIGDISIENQQTVRYFHPYYNFNNTKQDLSFAMQILKIYEPTKFSRILENLQEKQFINYSFTGNQFVNQYSINDLTGKDSIVNWRHLSEAIVGKIVLFGDIDYSKTEDLHYSPLNDALIGRSQPDMKGVFIHANIIQMLLNESKIIYKIPTYIILILSILINYVLSYFLIRVFVKRPIFYHIIFKLTSLILLLSILYVKILLLDNYAVFFEEKWIIVPLLLSADLVYIYDGFANYIYNKKIFKKYKTIFLPHH